MIIKLSGAGINLQLCATAVDALWKSLTMEKGVYTAIGCHPKSATDFSPRYELGMKKMLEHPNVVALGEIGLDYSGT